MSGRRIVFGFACTYRFLRAGSRVRVGWGKGVGVVVVVGVVRPSVYHSSRTLRGFPLYSHLRNSRTLRNIAFVN